MRGARVLAVGVGYLGLVAAALFFLLPLLWIVLTSLKTPEQLFQYPPRWWPERPTLENYAYLFSKMPFLRYSFNSLKVAGLSTLRSVASCSLAAYAFARPRFAGRTPLIYLPLAGPALTALAIFVFMFQWNDLLTPVIYLSDPHKFTLTLGLAFFKGTVVTRWNLIMAGAVISAVPILILYAAAQRYFVQGVALTGIKG